MKRSVFASVSLLLLAGCASTSIYDERESLLADPVDCAVAEQDIADLEAAMPSRRERALSVVQSVTPIGAASGVVRGSYRDRAAVLTGRTEGELSARIDEIRATCGLEQPEESSNE
ncbi:MAG: hypothetical protein AAFQ22_04595 [Pseudomonadota bacterium]